MKKSERILLKHLSDDEANYIAEKRFLYESIIEAIDETEALTCFMPEKVCRHKKTSTPLIYIAGKVTGEPLAECSMKFGFTQKIIEAKGAYPVNPLEVVGDLKTTWEEAMKKCISALMKCDAVYFLPDAKDSKGAQLEKQISQSLGIKQFENLKQLDQYLANYGK